MRNLTSEYFAVFALAFFGLITAPKSFAADNLKARDRENVNMIAVGLANMPSSIDPLEAFSFQHFLVIQCLYQSLTRIAESGDLVSDLADSWHISADGRIYTFELKKSFFQNGDPVTSHDVAVSLSRHLWPGSKSVVANYLKGLIAGGNEAHHGVVVSGIKAMSSSRVQITLVAPYPPFLSILAMPSFGVVNAKEMARNRLIGSGPYLPNGLDLPSSIRLKRYQLYSGHKPALEALEVKHWQPGAAVAKTLQDANLDVVFGVPLSSLHEVHSVPNFVVSKSNSVVFNHLFFNERSPLLHDREFREDLAGLIYDAAKAPGPKSDYLRFAPHYVPHGLMPESYYDRDLPTFSVNNFKSKWGSRLHGLHLRLVFFTPFFDPELAGAISTRFKSVGIDGHLDALPPPEVRKVLESGDYDLFAGIYMANFADPDGILEPISPHTNMRYGTANTHNLFKELEKSKHVSDPTHRLKSYSDTLIDFEKQWHVIPMYQVNLPIVHNSDIMVPDTSFRYEAELFNFIWSHRS